jgi:hypothetical protein
MQKTEFEASGGRIRGEPRCDQRETTGWISGRPLRQSRPFYQKKMR